MRSKWSQRGFTLVEIIVVIAIIVILIAIISPTLLGFIRNAQNHACIANRSTIWKEYQIRRIFKPDVTLQTVLDEYTENDNMICPAGGYYSVVIDENGEQELECSVHGATKWDINPEKPLKALPQYLDAATHYFKQLFEKYPTIRLLDGIIKIGTNDDKVIIDGKRVKIKHLENFPIFLDKNNPKELPTDFRIVMEKDENEKLTQNIGAISYKQGAYCYIIYADGAVYKVEDQLYTGNKYKDFCWDQSFLEDKIIEGSTLVEKIG